MKKILLLFLFALLSITQQIFAQRASVAFKNEIFNGLYSEIYQQPLCINYKVLCPNGNVSRYGLNFYTNDSIKTSDDLDYVDNEYDKGHLAPAADFNCNKKMLFLTFSYLNCALQQKNLNRGVWKLLESHERDLAKNNTVVTVSVELSFSKNSKKLATGATIPDGFTKTIMANNKIVEKYYFPNIAPQKGKKYQDYAIKF